MVVAASTPRYLQQSRVPPNRLSLSTKLNPHTNEKTKNKHWRLCLAQTRQTREAECLRPLPCESSLLCLPKTRDSPIVCRPAVWPIKTRETPCCSCVYYLTQHWNGTRQIRPNTPAKKSPLSDRERSLNLPLDEVIGCSWNNHPYLASVHDPDLLPRSHRPKFEDELQQYSIASETGCC